MSSLSSAFTATGIAADIYESPTGFAGVPFRVRVTSEWRDWGQEANVVTRRIPGSNASVSQFMGLGPQRVQYELVLPSPDAYAALRALMGTEGTLTLAADAAAMDGATRLEVGIEYLELTGVLLVGIDVGSVERHGDLVFAMATFQRDGA